MPTLSSIEFQFNNFSVRETTACNHMQLLIPTSCLVLVALAHVLYLYVCGGEGEGGGTLGDCTDTRPHLLFASTVMHDNKTLLCHTEGLASL